MRKTFLIFSILFLLLHSADTHAQDLQLWYDEPAREWVEALPIGNGRLGAMVFGGINNDRIQFNEETLWTGYPRDYNKKGAYKYLDSIRNLLFAGRQAEAEKLAEKEFMGLKSKAGDQNAWEKKVLEILQMKNNPSRENYDDKSWKVMHVPNYDGWEAEGFEGMDGAVWFRYNFVVPPEYRNDSLELDLNKISNRDITFINGVEIGTQNNDKSRIYRIPRSLLKKGKNSIAILVLNYSGKGGILGYKNNTREIGLRRTGQSDIILPFTGNWKYFVQNDSVPAVAEYQASYQPFGDLFIQTGIDASKARNYRRTLDLPTATLTTRFDYNGVAYTRTYFASEPDDVIAINFTADRPRSIHFETSLSSPHREHAVHLVDANTIALRVKVKDGALNGESVLQVKSKNGKVSIKDGRLVVENADEATILLTAATNFKKYNDVSGNPQSICENILKAAKGKSFSNIHSRHIEEYQQYFNTFSIRFRNEAVNQQGARKQPTNIRLEKFRKVNDPEFLALYVQYGRYLLISSSRPGTYPANLQGIWNDLLAPPWGSKYTTNINLEMNYWPAEILNLSPMHSSLFKMIKELSVRGRETAKEYYDAPGWVLHHNTDLWRGTAPINASNHGIWVTGGAWLCDHLWEHYLFTGDERFLRDTAYPIMRSASEFFNAFLIKDPKTGYLISTPSNSPEQGGLVAGPTMDHQIIRALFKNTIQASEILGIDEAFRKQLEAKYPQIAPNKIGRFGQLQEWMEDVDDTTNKHRHVSHLWAVYPGSEINWEISPDFMKAARQSLIYRGDAATGWSLGWKINLWARFQDGDHTFKLIQMLLSPAEKNAGSYPNLFDAHPPFQIDGNFGGAAGVGEMLVQSQTPYIELLPALPSALPEGEVDGIRARNGFTVSMKWQRGQLSSVAVKSNSGLPLRLKYKDKTIEIQTHKNEIYRFNGSLQQI